MKFSTYIDCNSSLAVKKKTAKRPVASRTEAKFSPRLREESNELFIQGLLFSRSYNLAPRLPPLSKKERHLVMGVGEG